MSMMIGSLKRRNEALQNECDTLAGAIDNLSFRVQEAYELLQKYEPAWVAEKMGFAPPAGETADTPAAAPATNT